MNERLKKLLGICDPPVGYQEKTATEEEFDRVVEQTERALRLGAIQFVRTSKAVTSWCDLYGRKVDE